MSNTLLGCAIGDALGKFAESKLSSYQPLLDWDGKTFIASEYHKLTAEQWTDDSQMSIMVAESLIAHGFDPEDLSQRYVEWIVSGRARGYGKTTLLAIHNLMNGKKYHESGVVGSWGNGTAMRAAPIGIYYRNDVQSLIEAATIDAKITHNSDEAVAGSIAIAMAASMAVRQDTGNLLYRIMDALPSSQIKNSLDSLPSLVKADHIAPASALAFLGTKADVRETVPSAIYCFLKFDNYQDAVEAAIRAGKDTDTTAAIVGSLFGAKLGMSGIDRSYYVVEDFDRLVQLDSQLYNRSNGSYLGAS
jgi:ADP-ribosylglycohydrolase